MLKSLGRNSGLFAARLQLHCILWRCYLWLHYVENNTIAMGRYFSAYLHASIRYIIIDHYTARIGMRLSCAPTCSVRNASIFVRF